MTLVSDARHTYRDIEACESLEASQDTAMLIALTNLKEIREMGEFENGCEAELCRHLMGWNRQLMREWYFSHEDIGTSEVELDELYNNRVLSSARHDLAFYRREPARRDDGHKIGIANIRALLRSGGFAPEDIGSSNLELDDLARRKIR